MLQVGVKTDMLKKYFQYEAEGKNAIYWLRRMFKRLVGIHWN